jgi:uncharacterized membrane protein YagU involved in acid resistance
MNWKRLWLTALLVFIVLEITNILLHGHILMNVYSSPDAAPAFRPAETANRLMWVFFVTGAVFSFFYAFIFAKGYEGRGLAEGIRYGFYIGLFYNYTVAFNEFVLYPIPYRLAWYWIFGGVVQSIVLGILAALVYRPKSTPQEESAPEAA